jgi:SPP1 gp7 family putative phage head morphogenesis protein
VTPDELARRQKAAQLAADRRLANDLIREYRQVWGRIQADVDKLASEIAAARAAGTTVNEAWLLEQGRLQAVERQVQTQIALLAQVADRRITDAQTDALTTGRTDAAALLRTTLDRSAPPGFEPVLPVRQVELLVGRTQTGAPLGELLGRLGPDAAARARRALIQGVALGHSPRRTATVMREALGGNMARALTIARTETLGVYRAATLETYRANGDVVKGWVWLATLGPRTCAVCVAMHGSFHTLDESLDSHPACRCTMMPATDRRVGLQSGPEWFAEQPAAFQRVVLGPGKLAAYRAGRVTLPDLVEPVVSPVWGPGLRERTLRELVG